jgi:signal transduction histidine kinase
MAFRVPFAFGDQAPLPLDQQRRAEHTLALARLFIAVATFAAGSLSLASSPSRYVHLLYGLLGGYVVFAIVALVLLRVIPQFWTFSVVAMHVVDVLVAAAVTLSTGAASSPFFVLFFFAVLAAAYRWGFAETVVTAGAAIALLFADVALVGPVFHETVVDGVYEPDHLIMRSTYLLLAGVLTGYLAQSEKQFRSEVIAIGAIVGRADVRAGFKKTMAAVFDAVLRLFDAHRLVLVVHEEDSDHVFMWEAGRSSEGSAQPVHTSRLESTSLPTYLFAPAAATWHAVRRGARRKRWDVVALNREGSRVSAEPWAFPAEFLAAVRPFDQLMTLGVELGNEWTGRLFLIDPHVGADRIGALGFGQRVMRQISPAVHNVYLLHRLRSTAGVIARARLARELHDGVIQTVMGVEMQLDALSRGVVRESPAVVTELRRFRAILGQEVVRLREVMQQLRPLDLGPDQLVDTMAEFVQRFQRETGIAARFITQLDRVALPPRACGEVAQILLEALVNVRRHSGARNVFVRLATVNRDCRLSIDDDGCGFPFAGRLSQADLEASRRGPLVIRERVRLLGGELTIESDPGQGARLEIAVPLSGYGFRQ